MGFLFGKPPLNAVISVLVLIVSGVSSVSALSAGDDSAPEVSENSSGSNGFRGVVNEGLRNGVAGFAEWSKREAFVSD